MLTIVVFFHELGHFLVARWCGVRVMIFSIGFGPELFGFNDRHGTRWKVSAIPLGGYVKFFGDENAASVPDHEPLADMTEAERRDSFVHKQVAPRAAIVAAGPIANFILAIVIFAGLFMILRQAEHDRPRRYRAGRAARRRRRASSPAMWCSSIDGQQIDSFADMQRIVSTSAGETLDDRGRTRRRASHAQGDARAERGQGQLRQLAPHRRARHQPSMAPGDVKYQPVGPLEAVRLGRQETWFVIDRTLSYIGGVLSGREAADQLAGRFASPRSPARWRASACRR